MIRQGGSFSASRRQLKPRARIVCEAETLDRSSPYTDPRCDERLRCALLHNLGRARPRPEREIIAQAIEARIRAADQAA